MPEIKLSATHVYLSYSFESKPFLFYNFVVVACDGKLIVTVQTLFVV